MEGREVEGESGKGGRVKVMKRYNYFAGKGRRFNSNKCIFVFFLEKVISFLPLLSF